MANENWFYATSAGQQGPVSLEALQGLVQSGELQPDQLVWTQGLTDWTPARSITTLFPQNVPAAMPTAPIDYAPASGNLAALGVMNYFTPPKQIAYAGFWLRFCAAVVDGIMLWVVGFMIRAPFLGLEVALGVNTRSQQSSRNIGVMLMLQLISILMAWLYSALMESSEHQATLGKLAVGIRVTDMAGARISFGRATGRHFAKIISGIILCIGYIMAGFTQQKQALHDQMASTLVIKKSQ